MSANFLPFLYLAFLIYLQTYGTKEFSKHFSIKYFQTLTFDRHHGRAPRSIRQGDQQLPGAKAGFHRQLGVQTLLQSHHQPFVDLQRPLYLQVRNLCIFHLFKLIVSFKAILWWANPVWCGVCLWRCGGRCSQLVLLDVLQLECSSKVQGLLLSR